MRGAGGEHANCTLSEQRWCGTAARFNLKHKSHGKVVNCRPAACCAFLFSGFPLSLLMLAWNRMCETGAVFHRSDSPHWSEQTALLIQARRMAWNGGASLNAASLSEMGFHHVSVRWGLPKHPACFIVPLAAPQLLRFSLQEEML